MLWELDWTMLPLRFLSNSRTLTLCLQGPGNSVVALCWCLPALPLLLPSVSLCHVLYLETDLLWERPNGTSCWICSVRYSFCLCFNLLF